MADRQQPAELIWELNDESQVFADLRAFHLCDGDDLFLEVVDSDQDSGWRILNEHELRLHLYRFEADAKTPGEV